MGQAEQLGDVRYKVTRWQAGSLPVGPQHCGHIVLKQAQMGERKKGHLAHLSFGFGEEAEVF